MNPVEFFYETFVKERAQFKVPDLFGKRGGPKNFSKITLLPQFRDSARQTDIKFLYITQVKISLNKVNFTSACVFSSFFESLSVTFRKVRFN